MACKGVSTVHHAELNEKKKEICKRFLKNFKVPIIKILCQLLDLVYVVLQRKTLVKCGDFSVCKQWGKKLN